MLELRSTATAELSDLELTELRMLLYLAFDGGFDSHDWNHTLGGRHFMGLRDGAIVAHAAVVARELRIGDRTLPTGYVEGVAVAEEFRREGYGHRVMAQLGEFLAPRFDLGALSAVTRFHGFYGRLGWKPWRGPTAVISEGALEPTPQDDGGVLILETPTTGALDLDTTLACDWREGDVW